MSRSLRALDLFCGAGGASMGLHRAGFDVTGVDIKPQPRYPFRFVQGDALRPPFDLREFDFIWASPPCQAYSNLTPRDAKINHSRLIDQVRRMMQGAGTSYCIENVGGARGELRVPFMLCGSMFGLRTQRHRYFETSPRIFQLVPRCDHSKIPLLVTTASRASIDLRRRMGMAPKTVQNARAAYGVDWMSSAELAECIPPAYSEFIGRAAIAQMQVAA